MVRRKLSAHWCDLCAWFVRRAPFPPDRSLRLLTFFTAFTGLPRPCPVGVRGS